MKIFLWIVLIFLVVIGVNKIVSKIMLKNAYNDLMLNEYKVQNDESKINKILLETSNELNKELPKMVDEYTRLDNIVTENDIFQYNYTLINANFKDVSKQELRNSLNEKLTNFVCQDQAMKVFVKNYITVNYAYFDKTGKEITVISIPPSNCKVLKE